jgi:hypothetical protein
MQFGDGYYPIQFHLASCPASISQMLEKKWECSGTVHHLFIDFKTACVSVRREVLYSIIIDFSIPLKLVNVIKMCLN